MEELRTIFSAVLPVFLIVAAGLVLRRVGWLTVEADASLLKITINVLIPCLAFDSLLGNRAFAEAGNVWLPPLVGFASVVLGLGVAAMARRWLPEATGSTRRTFTFCVAMYNYGYIPIPLTMALFDRETVGVLFVHNLGVEVAFWVFGLMLLAGAGLRASSRRLLNVPLATIALTLALNPVLPRAAVPPALMTAVHMVGQCAVPLGMMLVGATMADHWRGFGHGLATRAAWLGCGLRLGVLPLLFLLIARWLPCPLELKRVIVVQAAMPSAVFPIILVRHYGGDPQTALAVIITTSLAGLITIPLWLQAGLRLVGLN